MALDFNQWYEKIKFDCDHHEFGDAYFALRKWDEMITLAPASTKDELMQLYEKLLFTAFPSLPVNQAADVVEKQLLNLIASEVDVDEVVYARFLFLGYGSQEDDRKVLQEAILKNNQRLGGKTVSEWLKTFDNVMPPENREEESAREFFTKSPDIAALGKSEQSLLYKVLQVYDQWLARPIVTIYDVAVVYQKLLELEQKGVKEINPRTFQSQYFAPSSSVNYGLKSNTLSNTRLRSETQSQQTISLPLLQALSKYQQLGQQVITSEKIKLKTQIEPVRPSLVNWLKYYRDELGIGQHSSVERGEFLFRSENGKKLSPEERERISLILKSVEEYLPIAIDAERQEIIFPARNPALRDSEASRSTRNASLPDSRNEASRPSFQGAATPAFPSVAPNSQEFGRQSPTIPTRNNAGSVSFSAGHIFPAEKEVEEKPNSFRIRPMSGGR